jgi:DNA polymerase
VGEAPGEEEVRLGRPFVGTSGKRLDKALEAARVERSRIYITNTVLCRPENNADPSSEAISACSERLIHEIQETMPRKILALGRFARGALTGDTRTPIEKMRLLRPTPRPDLGDCEVRVTYHPAARKAGERKRFFDDIGWLGECEGLTEKGQAGTP